MNQATLNQTMFSIGFQSIFLVSNGVETRYSSLIVCWSSLGLGAMITENIWSQIEEAEAIDGSHTLSQMVNWDALYWSEVTSRASVRSETVVRFCRQRLRLSNSRDEGTRSEGKEKMYLHLCDNQDAPQWLKIVRLSGRRFHPVSATVNSRLIVTDAKRADKKLMTRRTRNRYEHRGSHN